MARKRTKLLEGLAELLTLQEAADATGFTVLTIRRAVRDGSLPAFIPRGRDPLRAGPKQGYRIKRDDLRTWYFGEGGQA